MIVLCSPSCPPSPGIFRKPKSETCICSSLSGASIVTSYTSCKVRFVEIFYPNYTVKYLLFLALQRKIGYVCKQCVPSHFHFLTLGNFSLGLLEDNEVTHFHIRLEVFDYLRYDIFLIV